MENRLSELMRGSSHQKYTENGAPAYDSLSNPILTLFGVIGSLRTRSETEITDMFREAYYENPDLAMRLLFYAGDIREGLGERRTFATCLKWLAYNEPQSLRKNMMLIPFFNRFDTWYHLVGTPVEDDMWRAMRTVFSADRLNMLNGDSITLLAKWLKSINTSSSESRMLARKTMKALRFPDEASYRKTLSTMRARLRVVEKSMSAGRWSGIDYPIVPSYAMKRYSRAFRKHDQQRFEEYMANVVSGKEKVNASTLFPYDLVRPMLAELSSWYGGDGDSNSYDAQMLDAQWRALPNYLDNNDMNILCMADVSGSMVGADYRAMSSSVGLSLYFAERNKGAFKNLYMTFSSNPNFIEVNPNASLESKVKKVLQTGLGYSTNLYAAFEKILKFAVNENVPQKDLPKALIVISDSEIDTYQNPYSTNFVTAMELKYREHGYTLPKLVFFQVESRQNTFLSTSENVLWVSGQSASTFKTILRNITGNSWDLVLDTLNSERYGKIQA